jgi:hypothetical protein
VLDPVDGVEPVGANEPVWLLVITVDPLFVREPDIFIDPVNVTGPLFVNDPVLLNDPDKSNEPDRMGIGIIFKVIK